MTNLSHKDVTGKSILMDIQRNFLLSLMMVACSLYATSSRASDNYVEQPYITKALSLNDKSPQLAIDYLLAFEKDQTHRLKPQDHVAIDVFLANFYFQADRIEESQALVTEVDKAHPNLKGLLGFNLSYTKALLFSEGSLVEQELSQAKKTLELAKSVGPLQVAEAHQLLGQVYMFIGEHIEAIESYQIASDLLEGMNEPLRLTYLKSSIALLNRYMHNFDKAIENHNSAIAYFQEHDLRFDELHEINSLAITYTAAKQYDLAEKSFLALLAGVDDIDSNGLKYSANLGLSEVAMAKQHFEKAKKYWLYAQAMTQDMTNDFNMMFHKIYGASVALAVEDIEAVQLLLAEVNQDLDSFNIKDHLGLFTRYFSVQSKLNEKLGNHQLALAYMKKWRDAERSEFDLTQQAIQSRYQVMFNTRQSESEKKLLAKEAQLQQVMINNLAQKNALQTAILFIGAAFFLLLVFLLYRQVKLSKRLEVIAHTDVLTGLYNRRYMMNRLNELISASNVKHRQLCVVIFDIDHFKQVNDQYGHAVGDEVLKTVSRAAKRTLAGEGVIGRIGGEEFMVLFNNLGQEHVKRMIEMMRQDIAQAVTRDGARTIQVTASFGVTHTQSPHQSLDRLFKAVDDLLYLAKQSGRDRVANGVLDT